MSAHGTRVPAWIVLLLNSAGTSLAPASTRRTEKNNSKNRKTDSQKSDEKRIKSKQLDPKFCTDQIELATNKSPKNHRLGPTQTPGISDHGHERKWRKIAQHEQEKSESKYMNPRGHRRIRASVPTPKISRIQAQIFVLGPL